MASLKYLWKYRAKFPVGSKAFFRCWAKRILSLPELITRNIRRTRLINKGATINETAEIGKIEVNGHKILLSIGKDSFLGKVNIALHAKVEIGNCVCINDGVEILTASHDVSDPNWKLIKATVIIEDYVWIGTGAMLLPGIVIKKGAVIGARAVVSKSVAEGEIVVGNPAKPIFRTRVKQLKYNPCALLASNKAWLEG